MNRLARPPATPVRGSPIGEIYDSRCSVLGNTEPPVRKLVPVCRWVTRPHKRRAAEAACAAAELDRSAGALPRNLAHGREGRICNVILCNNLTDEIGPAHPGPDPAPYLARQVRGGEDIAMRLSVSVRCVTTALLGALLGAGCTGISAPPSAPESPRGDSATEYGIGDDLLHLIHRVAGGVQVVWNTVADQVVEPGVTTLVTGSRYRLTFPADAVENTLHVSIKERDASIVDVELGPDGAKFESPVTLTIDYAGTANDPRAEKYHGKAPRVFWWNPVAGAWEAMVGVDDPKTWTYTVELRHFSRYAMGDGTSGWEGPEDPDTRPTESVR